jgi:hypothetical protein
VLPVVSPGLRDASVADSVVSVEIGAPVPSVVAEPLGLSTGRLTVCEPDCVRPVLFVDPQPQAVSPANTTAIAANLGNAFIG